jgi:Zn-dependent protease with chaperone function
MALASSRRIVKIGLFVSFLLFGSGCTIGPKDVYSPKTSGERARWQSIVHRLAGLGGTADPSKPTKYWKLGLIKSQDINAYNSGDGKFYVTDGFFHLSRPIQDAILAHMLAHDVASHVGKRVAVTVATSSAFTILGVVIPGAGLLDYIVNPIVINSYGQQQELEADRIAIWILTKRGGNFTEVKAFREYLNTLPESPKKGKVDFFSNYPLIKKRISQIDQIIAGKVKPQNPHKK